MAGAIVSAKDAPAQLRVAILAMKQFNRGVVKEINAWTRQTFAPVWTHEVHAAINLAPGAPFKLMSQGVRMKTGNPPRFIAGGGKRRVTSKKSGGGLHPVQHWPGFEYGANRTVSQYDRRSPKGKVHKVRRVTTNHLPKRRASGRVYAEATKATAPRVISGWSQYIIRAFMEALEAGAK